MARRWQNRLPKLFFYFNIIFPALFTAYNLSTGNNQDGITYTSVILSIMVTLFILFYHFSMYTTLFSWFDNSKLVAYCKNRFMSKPKPKNEDSHHSITDFSNSICRHDDILDILISDAVYSSTISCLIKSGQQPTRSVIEIN